MQVKQYLIRRLALLPLIMLGVSVIVFTLTRFTGSPVGIYATPNMTPDEVAALEEGADPSLVDRLVFFS